MRLLMAVSVSVALWVLFAGAAIGGDEPKTEKVRIILVGDSTVTDKGGWGLAFAELLKPGAECINLARSGHSSKSYYDKGYWKKALEQKPDFVLIQFGHNDQPGKGPERETDPKTTYRDYLSRYIDEARQAKAQPILMTSMVRRIFAANGKIKTDLTPYVEAMKTVAVEKKIPLIDLHDRSRQLVERLGPEKAQAFGPPHPKYAGKFDGTHLSAEGAAAIAPLVINELREVQPALRPYLPAPKESGPAKQ